MKKSLPNDRNATTNRSSEDAILDSAELLIGKHGYEGISLRQISVAAGSANHSAVHYYFKNKDGLIKEIIRRRSISIDARRKELMEKMRQKGFEKDTRTIMEVLLRPIADEKNVSDKCSYAAFLLALRVFNDISHWRTISESPVITRKLYELLQESLPDIPKEIVEIRFLAAFTLFLISVVDWDQTKGFSQNLINSRESYLQLSLDFATAGMMTPWQPE